MRIKVKDKELVIMNYPSDIYLDFETNVKRDEFLVRLIGEEKGK